MGFASDKRTLSILTMSTHRSARKYLRSAIRPGFGLFATSVSSERREQLAAPSICMPAGSNRGFLCANFDGLRGNRADGYRPY
jgi:hypothetical protein